MIVDNTSHKEYMAELKAYENKRQRMKYNNRYNEDDQVCYEGIDYIVNSVDKMPKTAKRYYFRRMDIQRMRYENMFGHPIEINADHWLDITNCVYEKTVEYMKHRQTIRDYLLGK